MEYLWTPFIGKFDTDEDPIRFHGDTFTYPGTAPGSAIGNLLCNQRLSDGTLSADVQFSRIDDTTLCGFILDFQAEPLYFINPVLGRVRGNESMFFLRNRTSAPETWDTYARAGDSSNLRPDKTYQLKATIFGSRLMLEVDGVGVVSTTLPNARLNANVGIFCQSRFDVSISNFSIQGEKPSVFVVMQFTEPYNALYRDIIRPICEEEFGLNVIRADEMLGPGLVIHDISQRIDEASVVVADITPLNANVYYEVGYAHALRKPTILIAERELQSPFDVSPFRRIIYDNNIGGKTQIERDFRRHLAAILRNWRMPGVPLSTAS